MKAMRWILAVLALAALAGAQGAVPDGSRRGVVRVVGNSLQDDGGPFLGLGWS